VKTTTSFNKLLLVVAIALVASLAANLLTNASISLILNSHQPIQTDQLLSVGVVASLFAIIGFRVKSNKTHALLSAGYGAIWAILQFIRMLYA
jgi:hypothetical protein